MITELKTLDDIPDYGYELAENIQAKSPLYVWYSHEKPKKKYTPKQRGALHVWCDMVAQVFIDAGFEYGTRVKFNGEAVSIDWDGKKVKEDVYKPMLEAMSGKKSTEDQSTIEPDAVVNFLVRHFAEKHGIPLPTWPSNR